MVKALATAKDGEEAKRIVADTQKIIALKRSSNRKKEEEAKLKAAQGMAGIKASLLAGKRRQKVEMEDTGPFDPFDGRDVPSGYFVLESSYDLQWLADAQKDVPMLAGWWAVEEYYERCLTEAFSGFAVFVGGEPGADIVMAD